MIRSLAGLALALAGLVPLGAGVLLLTRTRVRLGLSIFTGMAAALVLLPPVVYAGLDPTVPIVLLLGAIVLVCGLLVRKPSLTPVRVELGPLLVLLVPLVLLAARGVQKPVDAYDAFANWTLKAKLLFAGRTFADASIAPPVHREYPLGLPALEAYVFHAMGGVDERTLHVLFPVFLGGLALVAWNVLRPYVGAWPLTAGLSLVLWMPAARDQALSQYADVPLACLFVSAALLLGADQLALASVFAAAALATKRDAIAFCFVLYAVALLGAIARRERERIGPLLAAAVLVALTAVPWWVFSHVHDLRTNDVGPSLAHADELSFTLGRFMHVFVDRAYLFAVPLAAAFALALLARRRHRLLALGSLALGFALVAALALVYLGGRTGVRYLVSSTAERTLITPTLLAAVLLPLLVTRALGLEPEPRLDPESPRSTDRLRQRLGTARARARRLGRTRRPPRAARPRPSAAGRAPKPSS